MCEDVLAAPFSFIAHTSITLYVEFLMNSSLEKFLLIVDALMAFCPVYFALLRRLNEIPLSTVDAILNVVSNPKGSACATVTVSLKVQGV